MRTKERPRGSTHVRTKVSSLPTVYHAGTTIDWWCYSLAGVHPLNRDGYCVDIRDRKSN